jgi:hypothetical protein
VSDPDGDIDGNHIDLPERRSQNLEAHSDEGLGE